MTTMFNCFLSRYNIKKNLCLSSSTIKSCKKKTRLFIKLICSLSCINVMILNCIKMSCLLVIIYVLSSRIFITNRCFLSNSSFRSLDTVRYITKIENSKDVNLKNHCILFFLYNLSNFLSIIRRSRSSSE